MSLTKNPQPPTRKFFRVQTRWLVNLFEPLNSSSAISGGAMVLVSQLTTAGFRPISKYKYIVPWLSKVLILSVAYDCFRVFLRQNNRIARGFAWEYLWSSKCYRPGQRLTRLGKSCTLQWKKLFGWIMWIFCEWHKWQTFRPSWPTSPGPGPKPLDGSISLKFLLETRLQSEYFDTLDDLLGFRVQTLWSKVIKNIDWLVN